MYHSTSKPAAKPAYRIGINDRSDQQGASLIVVLLILIVVSILGVGGAQIALMAERGARNDRDMQVAWQSAEAALIDAEVDLTTPLPLVAGSSPARGEIFGMATVGTSTKKRNVQVGKINPSDFPVDCGNDATLKTWGLCGLPLANGDKPAWLNVDFLATKDNATVPLGQFTGRKFAAGATGVQPAQVPRYIIEAIPDLGAPSRDKTVAPEKYVYRVTSMGFGPRDDIQAVVQMIYRN